MLNTEDSAEVVAPDNSVVDEPESDHRGRQTKWALWTFVVYLGGAFPLLLWIGSYRWFFGDEWAFLTNRAVTVDGLFRPHNQQHWVTIPVLVYRGLYSIVGLHSYWPYQMPVVLLHLTAAALLRVIMRRAGVNPWLATVAAGAFVLLGAAEDNILWAFQITFVGALVAGLVQIILADHDGPIDRRDWLGLGAGLVALMMSGQAPSLIFGAGVVCVLRRRWAAAIFHTVPLGLLYLAWVKLEDVTTVYHVDGFPFSLRAYGVWMREAAVGLFVGLGHFSVLGIVLAAILVGGTVLAWCVEGTRPFVARAAVPLALVAVCVLSMTTAAPSRFFLGADASRAGRYVGVMAALTLPALAVAADAITRRWSRSLPFVCLLFVVPIPFNAAQFRDDQLLTPAYFRSERTYIGGLPDLPIASEVPPWIKPNEQIVGQPDMTIGWMLQAKRDGALPSGQQLDILQRAMLPLQLGVVVDPSDAPDGLTCATYDHPIALDPPLGESWIIKRPVRVALRRGDQPATPWLNLGPPVGLASPEDLHISITRPDLHLLVEPALGADEFDLCR